MVFDIFGHRHPLMRSTDTIDIIGYNGDRCRISGIGCRDDWGPLLAPASTGLWDAPFRTNWGKGAFGQRFDSWSPERRDVVFTVHIMNPRTGNPALDDDPDLWHTTYSRWKAMWSQEYESTVVYGSVDGERRLGLRLLQTPKPFSAQPFEGPDPHLFTYGSIIMATAAELPYYVGATERYAHEIDDLGDHWFRMPFYNPCTVSIWPRWFGTDQAAYFLPDYSWGWEEYGRGVHDEGKTVRVPHASIARLRPGQNVDIDTQPDVETIRCEDDTLVVMNGTDFEYPILPGCGDPPEQDEAGNYTNGCVVRMVNITNPNGARVELELPRWYAEPFGTARVA